MSSSLGAVRRCRWCSALYLDYARHIGADCSVMNEAFGELRPVARKRRSSSYISNVDRREEGLQFRSYRREKPSSRQKLG